MRLFPDFRPLQLSVLAAATLPALLAYNVSPSPTFLNQALAFLTWGLFAAALAAEREVPRLTLTGLKPAWPSLAALAIVAAAAGWSGLLGGLPASLSLSALATLLAAMVLLVAGVASARSAGLPTLFAAFCAAWVVAGVAQAAVALVQVLAPTWADGDWIARSGMSGRAVGNLRQPNHLSSLLMWSAIAVIGCLELRRLSLRVAAGLMALMVFAVVLTASRTGVVGVALLAVWALIDRRLLKASRVLLLAAPVLYVAGWALMAAWAATAQAAFGGQQRLADADLSSSRFAIWSDTLALIRANPWSGVGFGEFNFAWSLSEMPNRPVAFFDHTHNVLLQLAVELGIPLAAAVTGLLLVGLGQGFVVVRKAAGEQSVAVRCSLAMLLLIALHSLLEYPLWYSYFLLPAAWMLGVVAGHRPHVAEPQLAPTGTAAMRNPVLMLASAAVVVATLVSVVDYTRVVSVFTAGDGLAPLVERIERGRRSVLFSHHAAYAAATVADDPTKEQAAFDEAAHYLLDTRLMTAWAQAFAQRGDLPRARHLAQRLREFRHAQAAGFFAPCERVDAASRPFQCEPPSTTLDWRDFQSR